MPTLYADLSDADLVHKVLQTERDLVTARFKHSLNQLENTASLGLVEKRNNKIRALQRQAYGSRDVAYRTLTIVAAFRPP